MSICCGRPQTVCNYIARVKVLSDGSEDATAQYKNCEEAIAKIGMAIELDVIEDKAKIADFGATKLPAIVIGSKLVAEGSLVSAEDAEKLIRKAVFGF